MSGRGGEFSFEKSLQRILSINTDNYIPDQHAHLFWVLSRLDVTVCRIN